MTSPIKSLELPPEAVQARFRWARRRGHPAYLWPDVPVDHWQTAVATITDVTRSILRHHRPRLALPPGTTAHTLGIAAFTCGMGPLLGYWLENGTMTSDAATASLLARHLDHGRQRWNRAVALGTTAVRALHEAPASVIVLKGMHTARAYFPDPGTRPMADVDLLIEPAHVAAAERTLRARGFTPTTGIRKPYRRDWVTAEPAPPRSLEIDHADNPMSLDLHASLTRVFAGTRNVNPARIAMPTDIWNVGEESVRVLRQPLLVTFLALHASEELHHLRLVRLFELTSVIRQDVDAGTLDWRELQEYLASEGLVRFTYPAFHLVEKLVPGTVDHGFLQAARRTSPRLMCQILDRLEPETCFRLRSRSLAERFMWAATPVEALRCSWYTLRPRRTNAAALGRVLPERFFRLIRGRVSIRPGSD